MAIADYFARPDSEKILLAIITHTGGTIYLSDRPYITEPSDVPANQPFEPLIQASGLPEFRQSIQELTGGKGVHYAFEAIGLVPEPFKQAILCTRRRGVTVFVGHAPDNTPVDFDAKMLALEKTVIGSMYGTCRPG